MLVRLRPLHLQPAARVSLILGHPKVATATRATRGRCARGGSHCISSLHQFHPKIV